MIKNLPYQPNSGFMVGSGRKAKAQKILKIISDASQSNDSCEHRRTLLDIGTGNGEISYYIGEEFEVTSVDVVDQRQISDGYMFICLEGDRLPFPDQSFDIIVSNHIIEHVTNANQHLAEIARLVRDNGLVYLATPNRLWPWEVHYQIPLLHYLPVRLFMFLMKLLNRYHEDIQLMNWWTLKQKTQQDFTLTSFSDRICKWPQNYYMDCPKAIAKLLSQCPLWIYRYFTFIHPTLIVILRRKLRKKDN
jgi:2-polyprenyl-3-methyl-5-hydroxy-6-metoxy-1,4-benzoquinol methylase